jgi:hypothetical protein
MALRLCLFGDYSRETPLRTAVTYPVAVALVFGASQVLWSFMLWLHPWSASSLKAPLSRSCRATAYRASWPGPTAPAPFPLSLGCIAVPGCTKRRNKSSPTTLWPGAMLPYSSTVLERAR